MNAAIIVQSMLKTPAQFASVPIRTNPDGSVVRIKDVARVELGTDTYDIQPAFNGKPSAMMAIRAAAGANALDTADAVKAKLAEMSHFFPAGMKVGIPIHDALHQSRRSRKWSRRCRSDPADFLEMYLFMGNLRVP